MRAAALRCARAVVEYDGTEFSGSQSQPNARTVQDELEDALRRLTGEDVRVRFAGRTDAGVHARGQVAVFCLDRRRATAWQGWRELGRRLNHTLPDDLAVRGLCPVDPRFDPRRDAVARVYRYRIRTGGVRRPIDRRTTYEIDDRPDTGAMQAAAKTLVGDHDFAAFGSDPNGRTRRSVKELTVRRRGELIEITVVADAFLRRMVRSIVAVLLHVGRGRLAPERVSELLAARERALHGRAAPARGLTLERVVYAR
ncbi:MAG: tRNA pseudouridine(38-40) synthase TruA [Candidatus Limnocylindria bacterium]